MHKNFIVFSLVLWIIIGALFKFDVNSGFSSFQTNFTDIKDMAINNTMSTNQEKIIGTKEMNISKAIIMGNNFSFPLQYRVIGGIPIAEGDIIVDNSSRDPFEAAGDRFIYNNKWNGGEIPYKIDNSVPEDKIQIVMDAIAYWQEKTPIKFTKVDTSNEFNYPDYVLFIYDPKGNDGVACASNVGRQTEGGQQHIWIYPPCEVGNIIHELGHTVGLWHEQQRPDRNEWVRINEQNIIPGLEYNLAQENCNIDRTICDYPRNIGSYDYCSIMHYNRYAFSIQRGLPTIVPLKPVVGCKDIGQRDHLSQGDIGAVYELYPELNGSGTTPGGNRPNNYLQYQDAFFSMKYPNGGEVSGPFRTTLGQYSVYFDNIGVPFNDPIGVTIDILPNQSTLQDFVDHEKPKWQEILGVGGSIINEKAVTIDGVNGIGVTYTYQDDGTNFIPTIYLLDEGKVYTISYDMKQIDFNKYKPVLEYMIDSFRFSRNTT